MAASEFTLKIDLLNDHEFLQVIGRAVKMADAAESVIREDSEASRRELAFAVHTFRNWFQCAPEN